MAQVKTRHDTRPVDVPRTNRNHPIRNMTSLPAGKVVPLAAVPMLREDALNARFSFVFQMQQTVEVLLNGIDVVVEAWMVPHLAMPEFRTMDDLNLAMYGEKRPGEDAVTPFFKTAVAPAPNVNQVLQRLGKHRKPGLKYNTMYERAYNLLVNHARSEVSPHIPLRELDDRTLAQALWPTNKYAHLVADFDQAVAEGEVALNVAQQNLVLKGTDGDRYVPVASKGDGTAIQMKEGANYRNLNLTPASGTGVVALQGSTAAGQAITDLKGLRADLQGAVAMLSDNGISISLANLNLAREAQIFANIRKRYNAHEEMVIRMLMDGMTIPEQAWKHPIMLRQGRTRFGMNKRYSSDADALNVSMVDGVAAIDMAVAVPRCPPGGVMMVVAYIAPEQLFERQMDPYLAAETADDLPSFIEDHLDPEFVEIVPNQYIDQDHDEPDDIYAYGPGNYMWNDNGPGIGGRFFRPEVDAGYDEDRNALWAVETQNPRLTKDAYLVPADIHLKPFWTSTIDPFDCITLGRVIINGLTQFGPMLIEALPGESDYDAILSRVDQGRIDRQPVPVTS